MRRLIVPLVFGIAGVAVLVWLGMWQMQRLAWKEGVLAEIDDRIAAAPIELPQSPDPDTDKYLPVEVTGQFGAGILRVLVSQKQIGAGYRLISPFEMEDRTILLDRGFIRVSQTPPAAPPGTVSVIGNLHWPDDRNSSTPDNDVSGNTWFARDIVAMAEVLETEPTLVVVKELSQSDTPVTPLPVDTSGIPNDHLQYAITWFGLAIVWAFMTLYLIYRMRNPAKGDTL